MQDIISALSTALTELTSGLGAVMGQIDLGLGVSFGVVLLAGAAALMIVGSALRGRAAKRDMLAEITLYRRRHAMAAGHLTFVRKASSSLKALPPFMFEGPSFGPIAAPAAKGLKGLPVEARAQGDDIVQQLADSLNSNIGSAIAITDLIIEADLDKDAERKAIAGKIRKEAAKLDATFWGKFGKAVEGSNLPKELKAEIKRFYDQVGKLKADAGKIPGDPSADDILKVGMEAVDILQTAATMYDIIERSR